MRREYWDKFRAQLESAENEELSPTRRMMHTQLALLYLNLYDRSPL